MAMQDMDANRRYTKYKRHVDESNERIQAETVNTIQSDIETSQVDSNEIKDTAFEERVYTIFNNNLFVNAMFMDKYSNGNFIEMGNSVNIILDGKYHNVSLKNVDEEGSVFSTHIASVYGDDIEINDFFLITNQYVPVGASLRFYLQNAQGQRFEINPNVLKTPLHFVNNITGGLNVVAVFKANALGETPHLNGYALLYWDAQVEKNLGLVNPDLQRFP